MYTIILAGGSGTRLFPLSRSSYPKQFIPLFNNESLFQKSVKRALNFSKPSEIFVVTNDKHIFLVNDQLKQLNTECCVISEPCGKNTLPAIVYAVKQIQKSQIESFNLLVAPSDQLISIDEKYIKSIHNAEKLCNKYLVTFGIVPTSPNTGYGYILPGKQIDNGYIVDKFVEKPDLKTAEIYIKNNYLWNSGMYCFSSKLFMDECIKYAPDVVNAFSKSINDAYNATPSISIDYGLMEKTNKAAVVPLTSDWSDVGNFDAYYNVSEKDSNDNFIKGEYISPDGKNNLIISDKLVSTIGLNNIAVIDTDDVLLVCPKDKSQRVGDIAEMLKNKGDERSSLHTTVHRPWGIYTTIQRGNKYLMKKITVNPRMRLSLQYHHHRSEHWVVVSGTAEVINGDKTFFVRTGESTFVQSGVKHRLSNPGMVPLEVIEVQIGDLLTEDDIVRCDDDFKR